MYVLAYKRLEETVYQKRLLRVACTRYELLIDLTTIGTQKMHDVEPT